MQNPKKVIIQKNKSILRLECPFCHTSFLKLVTTINTKCSVCNKNVPALVNTDPFNFYAPLILKKLRTENKVILNASDYNLTELQKIIYYFEGMDLEIGKIEKKEIEIEKAECSKCGVCNNCVECANCKTHYAYVENKGKCPKCKSKSFNKTFIKEFEKRRYNKIEKPICPYCKSSNVRRTWFDPKLKTCPRCGSKKISKKKKIEINEVIFEKKQRNVL